MLESLFFIDIDGIYKFVRAKKSLRKPSKYRNYRKLTHCDLSAVFKQFGHEYHKGVRCKGLVAALDLEKIATANELRLLIRCIQRNGAP